jgi:hypothetical protein
MFTPAISFAADLLGGQRAILIALAWGSLVSFLLLWAADGFWQMPTATVLLAINWTTIMPLIETVAVGGIRSGALDYGKVRLWGSLSFIVASLGSGLLIGTLGAETVLPLLLGGTALMVLGAHLSPRELGGPAPLAASGLRRLKLTDAFDLVRAPLFLLFLLAASLVQASQALYYSFGSLHWRAQGIPDGVIGALWSAASSPRSRCLQPRGGHRGDRHGKAVDACRACGNLALGAHGGRSAIMGNGAAADAPCHELRRGSPRFHPFYDPCRARGSRRHCPRPLCRRCHGPRAGRNYHRLRPSLPDVWR